MLVGCFGIIDYYWEDNQTPEAVRGQQQLILVSFQENLAKYLKSVVKQKGCVSKLDGVGPVDNRPSTNKLHHFVQKKN